MKARPLFRHLLNAAIGALVLSNATAAQLPVFDVHIHYNQDMWESIPPERAAQRLRAAGIVRAMVSSTSDEGTQKLYRADPKLIVPALGPYRKRIDRYRWIHDESVIPYLKRRLAGHRYAAIGEFHIRDEQTDLPVVRAVVQLARKHHLLMHVHSDAGAIERIFDQYPEARILWAHAGFEPADKVRQTMARHKNLWADLSIRWEIFEDGRFKPGWKALLTDYSDRFMLGVDTYKPMRWVMIKETIDWYESMFAELPPEAAQRIRYDNAERVIGKAL
ncbi:MAG TPA: amidohydrolase family protein [Gammaproteobacteria bacterium]|nr:amidohydrolase family protein [Gammaproteobacteria bacterium]